MKRPLSFVAAAFAVLFSFTLKAELVNQLTFNDSTDLMAATVGSAGAPYTKTLNPGSGNGNMTSVDDVDILAGVASGAVKIPQNSFILFPHGVSADKADDWCMVMRVYLAKTPQDNWFTMYSLDQTNEGDGFLFYKTGKGGWGCGTNGPGGWDAYAGKDDGLFGRWNTLVISVTDKVPTLYVNGTFVLTGGSTKQSLTDRANILIGGDNDGDDNDFYVDYVSVYDEAKPAEIFGAGDVPMLTDIPETVPLSAVYADPVVSGGTATFSADVVSLGGADSAQFKLAYAKVGETLPAATLVGTPVTAAGQLSYGLSGLENGAVYQYRIVVVDNEGKEAATAKEGSFLASDLLSIGPVYRPGLIQAKFSKGSVINGSPDSVKYPLPLADLLSRTDCEFDFTYGAFMGNFSADGTKTYQNPYSGTSWGWDSEYSAFMYEGEIHLSAGEKLVLYGRFDDGSSAVVNGTTMFDQHDAGDSGYNRSIDASKLQVFEVSDTGWYPIACSVYDWSGGKVIKDAVSAVQYNLSGTKNSFVSTAIWSKLEDPGDGSLLRSKDTVTKFMQVAAPVQDGLNVKVSASFTGLPSAAVFYAYTSTSHDCGDDPGRWEGKVKIADIAAGDTAMTEYDVAGLGAFPYARFGIAAVTANPGPDVRCTTYAQLSSCVSFESEGLTVIIATPDLSYESGSVPVVVAGFGEYTSLDLTLEVATDAEFNDIICNQTVASGVTTIGSYPVQIEGLTANTPYYFRVQITADGTPLAPTETVCYMSADYPAAKITQFLVEKIDDVFCSFTWTVSDIGEESESVSVYVEYADDEGFTQNVMTTEVLADASDDLSARRAVARGLTASTTKYFRLKAVNSRGVVSYSDVLSNTTAGSQAHSVIWANTGTDMNDPASWVELRVPTKDDTIFFVDAPVTQPHLTDDLTVYAVHFDLLDHSADCKAVGYNMTAEEGKTLTIAANYINQTSQYAIHCWAFGTNTISAPVCLTSGKPFIGGNGMTLVMNGEVSTAEDQKGKAEMAVNGSSNGGHDAKIVFGHANPDLAPKTIAFDGQTTLAFTDKDAFCAVPQFQSNHWGGAPFTFFLNESGEPAVWPALNKFLFNGYGHNGLTFDGAPMIWENCVFEDPARDNKDRTVNNYLKVKKVLCTDYYANQNPNGAMLTFNGTGLVEATEGYVDAQNNNSRYSLQVKNGAFYSPSGLSANAATILRGDNTYPVLAFDKDIELETGLHDAAFCCLKDKNAGLAGMGGVVRVTIDGGKDLSYKDLTTEDTGYARSPRNWVFGNKFATGTAVLVNNVVSEITGTISLYAIQGEAYVAGRFAGSFTSTQKRTLEKRGDGVVAFDGALVDVSDMAVYEGGVLVNGPCNIPATTTAKSGAFIGGTGTMEGALAVEGGGAVRPGELGGELTVKGNVSLASGATLKVDIAAGANGCLKLSSETARKYTASGATVTVNLLEGAPVDGLVKIMDWSEATVDGTPTLFDPASYTLVFNEDEIVHPKLIRDDTEKALYLKYSAAKAGFTIFLK